MRRLYKIAAIEFLKRAGYSEKEALDTVSRILANAGERVNPKGLGKDLDKYAKDSTYRGYPPLDENNPNDLANWCLDNMMGYNRAAVLRILHFEVQ